MALRAVGGDNDKMMALISWLASALYFLAAQAVAYLSTIEIGPNLLAAVTSVIGAVVLLGQAWLARKVRDTHAKVEDAETLAKENRDRIKAVEDDTP